MAALTARFECNSETGQVQTMLELQDGAGVCVRPGVQGSWEVRYRPVGVTGESSLLSIVWEREMRLISGGWGSAGMCGGEDSGSLWVMALCLRWSSRG